MSLQGSAALLDKRYKRGAVLRRDPVWGSQLLALVAHVEASVSLHLHLIETVRPYETVR